MEFHSYWREIRVHTVMNVAQKQERWEAPLYPIFLQGRFGTDAAIEAGRPSRYLDRVKLRIQGLGTLGKRSLLLVYPVAQIKNKLLCIYRDGGQHTRSSPEQQHF